MKDEDRVYVEALDFGALLGLVDQCLEKGFRIPIERIKLRE